MATRWPEGGLGLPVSPRCVVAAGVLICLPLEPMPLIAKVILGFAMLCGLVGVIGLVVWVKVRNGRK
jgi:hypothetical protein